jgi:hypothetical protein
MMAKDEDLLCLLKAFKCNDFNEHGVFAGTGLVNMTNWDVNPRNVPLVSIRAGQRCSMLAPIAGSQKS